MVSIRKALQQVAENGRALFEASPEALRAQREAQDRERAAMGLKPTPTATAISTPTTTPAPTPTSTPTPAPTASSQAAGGTYYSGTDADAQAKKAEAAAARRETTRTSAPNLVVDAGRARAGQIGTDSQVSAAQSAADQSARAQTTVQARQNVLPAVTNTQQVDRERQQMSGVAADISKQLGEPQAAPEVTSADVARATPKPAARPVARPTGPTAGERTADELMARYNKPGGVEVSGGSVTPNPMGPGSVAPRGVTPPGGQEGSLESESGPNKGKKSKMSESTLINAFLKLMEKQSPDMFAEAKKEKMAKKDWDGDGKVESEKDEVWGSRFKAAKKAGKMEEQHVFRVHLKAYDNREHEMVDDKTSEPVGQKPKGDRFKITVKDAKDRRDALNKATITASKSFGAGNIKKIEHIGMQEAKKWCESCESSKCTCKKMEESRDAATLGPRGQSGNTRARFAAAQQQKAHKQQLAGHVDDWTSSDEAPRINAAQDDGDEDALHQSATRYASGLKDHQRGFTTPESYARKMVAHLGEEVESIFSEEETTKKAWASQSYHPKTGTTFTVYTKDFSGKLKKHFRSSDSKQASRFAEKMNKENEIAELFSEEELAHFEAVITQQNITTKKSGGDKVAETVPTRDLTN